MAVVKHPVERVEQVAMPTWVEQPAIVMLSVNFDGEAANLAEKPCGDRRRTDEGAASAICLQRAADDQGFAGLGLYLLIGEHRVDRMVGRQLQLDRNGRCILSAAYQPGVGARTHGQTERIEQDRLARARLARQHAKAGLELKLEAFDQHDVADRELP